MKKTANKIRKLQKNNLTFLEMKSLKGQTLNLTEVEAVTKNKIDGLIPLTVKESGKHFTLIYNITGLDSLKNFLINNTLNKQLFGFLLQNILTMLKLLEANYFQFSSLLVSLGRIKVDPSSKRLYFIYVPIQYYDNGVNLKEFLLSIIDYANFNETEDLSFVSDYIRILNTGVNFSVFELQEYINSLTGASVPRPRTKKCPNCGKSVPEDANFCTECQYNFVKKETTGSMSGVTPTYDPSGKTGSTSGNTGDDLDWDSDWDENDDVNTPNDYDDIPNESGTTVLGDDSDEEDEDEPGEDMPTTLLNQPKVIVKVGVLKRVSNHEKREIKGREYLVGRSLKCDFSVPDNSAVGRRHAYIITKEEHFYLRDNESVNRTYINGKVIPPNENVEIFNDTKIRLANEDFVFTIITREE